MLIMIIQLRTLEEMNNLLEKYYKFRNGFFSQTKPLGNELSVPGNETPWQPDSESRLECGHGRDGKNKVEEEPESYPKTESFRKKVRMLSAQRRRKEERKGGRERRKEGSRQMKIYKLFWEDSIIFLKKSLVASNLKGLLLFSSLSVYFGKEPWPEVVLSLEIKRNAVLCYHSSDPLQLQPVVGSYGWPLQLGDY